MAMPPSTLQPVGLRHGIRHCPGGDDEMPCVAWGMGGKTYFVDPVNGSDLYDGLAPYWMGATRGPWQSLTHAFTPAPVSLLGEAVALVKGAYHDCLVCLPGTYYAAEAAFAAGLPITIPAVKDSIHVFSSGRGLYNGVFIGSAAHVASATLEIDAPDCSIEGIQINGPGAGFPTIQINGLRTIIQRSRIWASVGNGIDLPAAGAGLMSRILHNYFELLTPDTIAVDTEVEGVDIVDNNIYAEDACGIHCAAEADYTRIFYNLMRSKVDPLKYGIKFELGGMCCQVDENKIGRAAPGTSGIERRIWDLAILPGNHYGRNYQLDRWDGVAPPLSAIPRAGDIITDGGVGSGYSRD